jgi:peptidoglycan/xylan/chitin deacetylase (PgdA/CDA1 family)
LTSAIALTFHGIMKEETGTPRGAIDFAARRYTIGAARFVEALALLHPSRTCTAREIRRMAGGNWHILTFDDGLVSDHEIVFPALVARGFKATFFVTSGNIDQIGYCSKSQLREMRQAGMEIGSHGCTHRYLVTMPRSEIIREITQSKNELENLLGTAVTSFAPVGGHFRNWMPGIAEKAGYEVFATMIPGRTAVGKKGILSLRRNHIQSGHTEAYIRRVIGAEAGTLAINRCWYMVLHFAKRILGMGRYDLAKARLLGTRWKNR